MSSSNYTSAHLVGLGGTGVNIIQALIESERTMKLLSREDFKSINLAIDVADGDIDALMNSYKYVASKLEQNGISLDRLWVKAFNIKFNTPNALFEFMEKYNTYLYKEGIVIRDYKPWVQSYMSIPPLAGGVGRQRALSKAVYALNYYHYVELNSTLSVFKDKVLTSKLQPVVFVIFGLGGGTGSGMVFDFVRHLRIKMGTAVPIVGLAILPSAADDLLARGPAPYAALTEAELLFNRELNEKVIDKYGEPYRNPFTAMFFLSLDPVYNNRNNLIKAKKELDESVIDIINVFTSFDLADLLSRVGTNNDFGDNWVNSIAYLKVRYPVDDYIKYLRELLQLSESTGNFIAKKRELLERINLVLRSRLNEVTELYRKSLISINSYRPETFEAELNELIHRGGKYEMEFKRQVKGLEDFVNYYNDRWVKALNAMTFPEDSVEGSLVAKVKGWRDEVSEISKNYEEFVKNFPSYQSEFENSITASKYFTSSHIRQLRSFLEALSLVNVSITTIDLFLRGKAIADELAIRYSKDNTNEGKRIASLSDSELTPLYKAASILLTRIDTEQKMIEQIIPGIRLVRKNIETRFKELQDDIESINRQMAQKDAEQQRLTREIAKIKIDLSGKKKLLSRNLERVKGEIPALKEQLDQKESESKAIKDELDAMAGLEKDLEITSPYRKSLTAIVNKIEELNGILSNITYTNSYYERVVELSNSEQLKILDRILKEQEESLKGEGILREIVDRDRFKDLVKSYVRIFGVPNYAGLSDSYRTDLIWATVGIPSGLWDQDMQAMISSTLNSYSSVEASKSISIRQIPQIDPWTITFLVIFAKARIDHIDKFAAMKSDAESVRKFEKVMFRSFLLEHGVQDALELASELENERNGSSSTVEENEQRKATK